MPWQAGGHVDVTDATSIEQATKELAAAVGDAGLSAVVNNAGIAVGGPVEYLAIADWRRQFEVNVFGTTRAVAGIGSSIRALRQTLP